MATIELPAVSHLPTEAKQRLLAVLARDLIASAGRGLVSVIDASGELVVCPIPKDAKAMAERALRKADPAFLAEMRRRGTDLSRTISLSEAADLPPESPPPSGR
jgi:hypothetical protein